MNIVFLKRTCKDTYEYIVKRTLIDLSLFQERVEKYMCIEKYETRCSLIHNFTLSRINLVTV